MRSSSKKATKSTQLPPVAPPYVDPPPGDFSRPRAVSQADAVVGIGRGVYALMPAYADIPIEFRDQDTVWNDIQAKWFFGGYDFKTLMTQPGIDRGRALSHLAAIQRSFEPKHEHKAAGVAYLMSLWFVAPKTTGHKGRPR